MRQYHFLDFPGHQQGAALLVFMLFMFLAASSWILAQSNVSGVSNQLDKITYSSMAQAKEVLLGRAATDGNRPGSLTCPDVNNDGVADGNFGDCTSLVGRFPWKTLDVPKLLDGTGEVLWYALSLNLRDHDNIPPIPINPLQQLQLTFDGVPNIAAIIFSPGAPLANQNGRPKSDAVSDYLDGSNNDGDNSYISGPPSPTFNDKALPILRNELFRAVNQRVMAEIRGPDDSAPAAPSYGLRRYHADNGSFPWADIGNDGFGDVGAVVGNLPYNDLQLNMLPPLPPYTWLSPNGWLPLVNYQRLNANAARITVAGSQMDVIPCLNSPCP